MNKFLKKVSKICSLGLVLCMNLLINVGATPHLIFGTWQTGNKTKELVVHAINSGIRHIDTAQSYRNEHLVGEAIRECIDKGIVKREDIEITTKIMPSEVDKIVKEKSKTYNEAVEYLVLASLKNLGTNYIDTILIHDTCGENIPAVWSGLVNFRKQHNIKMKIGVSNFLYDFEREYLGNINPDVVQNPFIPGNIGTSILCQYDWRSKLSDKPSTQLESYKPCGHGILLENIFIKELAEKYKVSAADICLQYYLQNGISPVFSSVNFEHIQRNASINKRQFYITPDDLDKINNYIDFDIYSSILNAGIKLD